MASQVSALRLNEGPNWGPEMWSRVASTPSEAFRVVGKSKTEKVHADWEKNRLMMLK